MFFLIPEMPSSTFVMVLKNFLITLRLLEMLLDTDIVDQLREINLHMYNFYFRSTHSSSMPEWEYYLFLLRRLSIFQLNLICTCLLD